MTKNETQRVGSRSDPLVVAMAVALVREGGLSFAAAERQLEHLSKADGPLAGRPLIDAKTIARAVRHAPAEKLARDTSSQWTLMSDETGNPTLILSVIRELATRTGGKIATVTHREADAIAGLHLAAPDLKEVALWRLARIYATRPEDAPTTDLDLFVALHPWDGDQEAVNQYFALAMDNGGPVSPFLLYLNADSMSDPMSFDPVAFDRIQSAATEQLRRRVYETPDDQGTSVAVSRISAE